MGLKKNYNIYVKWNLNEWQSELPRAYRNVTTGLFLASVC